MWCVGAKPVDMLGAKVLIFLFSPVQKSVCNVFYNEAFFFQSFLEICFLKCAFSLALFLQAKKEALALLERVGLALN